MKILYLHQYFNLPDMSGGTRSYEMARRFVDRGHKVHVITSWRQANGIKDWYVTEVDGIHIHWLPVPYSNKMSFIERIKAFFAFALQSSKRVLEIDFDVIFATSTPLTIALPAVYASKKRKKPMVFEVRDLWPELPIAFGALKDPFSIFLARRLELFAYRNSSAIVALSPGMKDGIVRTGYSSDKVAVIPNSCDNQFSRVDSLLVKSFLSSRPWINGRPLLIYAGTFGLINGVGYLIDLAKELNLISSNICIMLVGGGYEYKYLIDKARSAGVLNVNFYIEDAMPKCDMPIVFSAASMTCSLFIDLPEMRSNSSNKFFDSLAAGRPIFINYGGWMHDLIKKNGCGLAMWGRPMNEIAIELHDKMNDELWLKVAGSSARRLADLHFDRDILAIDLEKVLLAAEEGRPELSSSIAPGLYE